MSETTKPASDPTKQVDEPSAKPKTSRAAKWKLVCYDRKTKKICGRTCLSWTLLFAYYIAAYALFVALFVIIICVDYKYRNKNQPQHTIFNYQPILQEPGMVTIPKGALKNSANMIQLSKADTQIEEINTFLADYPKEVKLANCHGKDPPMTCTMKKDNDTLGPCSPDTDPTFGYKSNEPCVILKVNKIWGWRPELYTNRPASLKSGEFSNSSLPISCQVWDKIQDKKYHGNFKEVTFYPPTGLTGSCFPYCGKHSKYVQPFVMAKFKGLDSNRLIGVLCLVHASNIKDSRDNHRKLSDNIGSISFLLSADKNGSCHRHHTSSSYLFLLPVSMLLRYMLRYVL